MPSQQQRDVLTKLLSTSDPEFKTRAPVPAMTGATYYFRFYLARALEHAKMGDQYLQLLGPWKTMLNLRLTTWAESPEPTRSDSHAWSAHPNYDFLTIVAGIRPATPGFKSVTIEPHLGNLNHVSATMPAPQGKIEVQYALTESGIEATIQLPHGMSGNLSWNGTKRELHEGAQHLSLPQRKYNTDSGWSQPPPLHAHLKRLVSRDTRVLPYQPAYSSPKGEQMSNRSVVMTSRPLHGPGAYGRCGCPDVCARTVQP